MGLEQAGLLSKDIITALAKTSGNSFITATKPIEMINTCGLTYAVKLTGDIIQSCKKLIKADPALFSWAKPKPKLSIAKINPDSLALVHMTNYYPKNGQILSTNLATKAADGAGCARTTVHFAINKTATEHIYGNWNAMDYAIIAPFKETVQCTPKSKVIGGIQDDFFLQDAVKLPKGSVIVKYNPDVSSGNFLVSDAFEGIKLVETSNKNLNDATNTVIQKMGYTTYKDTLKEFLGASESDIKVLTSKTEKDVKDAFKVIEEFGGADKYKKAQEERLSIVIDSFADIPGGEEIINQQKEIFNQELELINLYEKFSKKFGIIPNAWENFCAKNGYINDLHSQTAWFKAENGISGIEIAEKVNNNSWGKNLKQILIKALNDAESTLPQGKSLGYDVKKVIKILEESETPKIAKERILKELNLKPMPSRCDLPKLPMDIDDLTNSEDFAEYIFQYIGLS